MGAGQDRGGPGAGGPLGTALCMALVWDPTGLRALCVGLCSLGSASAPHPSAPALRGMALLPWKPQFLGPGDPASVFGALLGRLAATPGRPTRSPSHLIPGDAVSGRGGSGSRVEV